MSSFDLPDMDDVLVGAVPVGGVPRRLRLADIDEDPQQPRQEFDPETLNELASTIAVRGVRQPVSVRVHPSKPGRWMLNFGARRLRASKLAGKTDIPAFVDTAFDSYDQVIENEQRESLKPLELALFVKGRLAVGDTRAEIARGLGKSRGYLTFVGALIEAPDWLHELYRSGKGAGIAELYELRRLHETHPVAVQQWCREQVSVTREGVNRLKDTLTHRSPAAGTPSSPSVERTAADSKSTGRTDTAAAEAFSLSSTPAGAEPARTARVTGGLVLWGSYQGSDVTIDLKTIPVEDGFVFVRQHVGGKSLCVQASDLRLVRVTSRG